MKRHFAFNILIICITASFAQKAPIKYGKLSDGEIGLDQYGEADAVILCDYGTYSFDGRSGPLLFYYSRHLRIKILSNEGFKYAKQIIPFYDLKAATFFENNRAYELKAQTLNVDNSGKIQKSKLKAKYWEETGHDIDYNNQLMLNFKDVKIGSIIEYEIKIPTIEIVNPAPWFIQHEIPILHSELRIVSPEYFNYSGKTYNVDQMDKAELTNTTTLITYKRYSLNIQAYQIQFVKKNVDAVSDLIPWDERMYIKIILDEASQRTKIPGAPYLFKSVYPEYKYRDKAEKITALSNTGYILFRNPTLETIPKKLFKDPNFGPPLNIYMEVQDSILKLTRNIKDETEKAWFIYDFIRSSMSWNGLFRAYVEPAFSKITLKVISKVSSDASHLNRSLNKPFAKRSGSNAEINFILINALRKAGIDANPVLTSTKDFSHLDPEFFNLHQFNHILVYVELNDETILMDAVFQDEEPLFEWIEMNDIGLVVKQNKASWISIDKILVHP